MTRSAGATVVVGLLHPGAMGATVGATLRRGGADVVWASAGRGPDTRERAEHAGLRDVVTIDALADTSSVVVSVCPPGEAAAVAQGVVDAGFRGLYLDANAVSPVSARAIRDVVEAAGGRFVDGGIVGGPARARGTTWLHLSGPDAGELAALFAAGPLETNVVGDQVGDASALKMCFAAFTKGSTALLLAQLAVARELGVSQALERQLDAYEQGAAAAARERVLSVTSKAWRFEGEMREIAATFAMAGAPGGFFEAAGELYGRMARVRGASGPPGIDDVLRAALTPGEATGDP